MHATTRGWAVLVLVASLASLALVAAGDEPNPMEDPLFWHVSAERAAEVLGTKCGAKTKSTGRLLSCGNEGTFKDTRELAKWASSPTPTRTTDYHTNHFNSDKWDLMDMKKGDIVIATIAKSGTTWMQCIMGSLLSAVGLYPPLAEGEALLDRMPWVDMRIIPVPATVQIVNSQPSPKVLKTHLPLDAIPFNPDVKYIEVVRDPRDVTMSMINHWCTFSDRLFEMANSDKFRKGPEIPRCDKETLDVRKWFHAFINEEEDHGNWLWSYWQHVSTYWAYRHLDNILFVHYGNLKKDFDGELKRIAKFLDIEINEQVIETVKAQTTLENMRTDPKMLPGMFDALWVDGKSSFINKGTNERWKDVLTDSDIKAMEEIAKKKLPASCWHYVKTGEMPLKEEL